MEENKHAELEKTQNSEEIIKEEKIEIDPDFSDIDKKTMKNNYIIVGILYFVVIVFSILLVIGIKNQKDTVKEKIDSDKEINDNIEKESKDEIEAPEVPEKDENKEDNILKPNNNKDNELNVFDQI